MEIRMRMSGASVFLTYGSVAVECGRPLLGSLSIKLTVPTPVILFLFGAY